MVHTRQAIETKILPPTNTLGPRVAATAAAGRIVSSYDHALSTVDNHAQAAKAFATAFDWTGRLVGGCLKSGDYVWVLEVPTLFQDCLVTAANCTTGHGLILSTQDQRKLRDKLANACSEGIVV